MRKITFHTAKCHTLMTEVSHMSYAYAKAHAMTYAGRVGSSIHENGKYLTKKPPQGKHIIVCGMGRDKGCSCLCEENMVVMTTGLQGRDNG